jgi:hypothetical protein
MSDHVNRTFCTCDTFLACRAKWNGCQILAGERIGTGHIITLPLDKAETARERGPNGTDHRLRLA